MGGLSSKLELEWKQIERPFNAKAIQKDRKRYAFFYCVLHTEIAIIFLTYSDQCAVCTVL